MIHYVSWAGGPTEESQGRDRTSTEIKQLIVDEYTEISAAENLGFAAPIFCDDDVLQNRFSASPQPEQPSPEYTLLEGEYTRPVKSPPTPASCNVYFQDSPVKSKPHEPHVQIFFAVADKMEHPWQAARDLGKNCSWSDIVQARADATGELTVLDAQFACVWGGIGGAWQSFRSVGWNLLQRENQECLHHLLWLQQTKQGGGGGIPDCLRAYVGGLDFAHTELDAVFPVTATLGGGEVLRKAWERAGRTADRGQDRADSVGARGPDSPGGQTVEEILLEELLLCDAHCDLLTTTGEPSFEDLKTLATTAQYHELIARRRRKNPTLQIVSLDRDGERVALPQHPGGRTQHLPLTPVNWSAEWAAMLQAAGVQRDLKNFRYFAATLAVPLGANLSLFPTDRDPVDPQTSSHEQTSLVPLFSIDSLGPGSLAEWNARHSFGGSGVRGDPLHQIAPGDTIISVLGPDGRQFRGGDTSFPAGGGAAAAAVQ